MSICSDIIIVQKRRDEIMKIMPITFFKSNTSLGFGYVEYMPGGDGFKPRVPSIMVTIATGSNRRYDIDGANRMAFGFQDAMRITTALRDGLPVVPGDGGKPRTNNEGEVVKGFKLVHQYGGTTKLFYISQEGNGDYKFGIKAGSDKAKVHYIGSEEGTLLLKWLSLVIPYLVIIENATTTRRTHTDEGTESGTAADNSGEYN